MKRQLRRNEKRREQTTSDLPCLYTHHRGSVRSSRLKRGTVATTRHQTSNTEDSTLDRRKTFFWKNKRDGKETARMYVSAARRPSDQTPPNRPLVSEYPSVRPDPCVFTTGRVRRSRQAGCGGSGVGTTAMADSGIQHCWANGAHREHGHAPRTPRAAISVVATSIPPAGNPHYLARTGGGRNSDKEEIKGSSAGNLSNGVRVTYVARNGVVECAKRINLFQCGKRPNFEHVRTRVILARYDTARTVGGVVGSFYSPTPGESRCPHRTCRDMACDQVLPASCSGL